jgi:hypothetical protein
MRGARLVLGCALVALSCGRSGGKPIASETKPSAAASTPSPDAGTANTREVPHGIVLPKLSRGSRLHEGGLPVYISLTSVHVGREQKRIADLDSNAPGEGYASRYKGGVPNDLLVRPLYEELRSRNEPKQTELLLFADQQSPYRVFVETLYTVGQSGYQRVSIVGRGSQGNELVGLETKPLSLDGAPIMVLIVKRGYLLRINGQLIGAECGGGSTEGTGDALYPSALDPCLRRLLPSVAEPHVGILGDPPQPLANALSAAETVLATGATYGFHGPK